MPHLLYIHGFNSGPGQKAETFRRHGFTVSCPQLPYDPYQALEILRQIAEDTNDLIVVGTSLGGFYGLQLLLDFPQHHYYIINPSLEPHRTIRRALHETLENFVSGERFTVDTAYLSQLESLSNRLWSELDASRVARLTLFLGLQDELLDPQATKERFLAFPNPPRIIETDQDHRFGDISVVIKEIQKDKG